MPIPDDYRDICGMLVQATKAGRVKWIEARPDTFVVRLPEYNLEIWSGTDEYNKTFIAMGLKDTSDRRLSDNWYIEENDMDYAFIEELYTTARRTARRIPDKLADLR